MRVAGLGFRSAASLAMLRAALNQAGVDGVDALATADHKAGSPALRALSKETGLPIHPVSAEDISKQTTVTQSRRVRAMTGAGSLCEAAALAAAGRDAILVQTRRISADGMVTVAIATGNGP